jgi:predicted secreted protein
MEPAGTIGNCPSMPRQLIWTTILSIVILGVFVYAFAINGG